MRGWVMGLGIGVLATSLASTRPPQKITQTNLKVGEAAPDFTLLSDTWEPVKLSDYRGKKNVVLAFYVLAFTSG
jgi:peroxiredoxin